MNRGERSIDDIVNTEGVNSFIDMMQEDDSGSSGQLSKLAFEAEGNSLSDENYNGSWRFLPYEMVKGKEYVKTFDTEENHYARVIIRDDSSSYVGVAELTMDNISDEKEFNNIFDYMIKEILYRFDSKGLSRSRLSYELKIEYDRSLPFIDSEPSPVLLAKGMTKEQIEATRGRPYLGRVNSLDELHEYAA